MNVLLLALRERARWWARRLTCWLLEHTLGDWQELQSVLGPRVFRWVECRRCGETRAGVAPDVGERLAAIYRADNFAGVFMASSAWRKAIK